MIKSMTGYGSETVTKNNKSLTVEIRSLNHRYCEINVRLPKKMFFLENAIKNQVKKYLQRGKIDIYITYQESLDAEPNIQYNKNLVQKYVSEINKMATETLLENDMAVSKILTLPNIFITEEEEEDEEFLENLVTEAISSASQKILNARILEGEMLKTDIIKKLNEMEKQVVLLPDLEKKSVEEYRVHLTERISELLEDYQIEESRIITETAIMADKLSVDEEIVRLTGHISHMYTVLNDDNCIGKKLDFIVQEMNREVNTITSKSNSMEIKNIAIELKNTIEKIREQIQNLE